MSTTRQMCTFVVDDLLLGVDVFDVQEVIRFHHTTRVPDAPTVVRGLMNLRGQIVVALDLRYRLGLPARPDSEPMNVVVRTPDGPVSLLVDSIGDVVDAPEDQFEPPPATLDAHARSLVTGVCKLDERLLLALDVRAAVDTSAPS
ncbi:MAG: chemotaxis protein CheW [Deltaproteobacteria bacterium]|nr:chemotaxis protein CheW [Nannocystaceae bacterium]